MRRRVPSPLASTVSMDFIVSGLWADGFNKIGCVDGRYRFGALGWTASAKQAPAISRIQTLMRVGPIL